MSQSVEGWLEELGLGGPGPRTPSERGFEGGGRYQIEIPEVEDAAVFDEVVRSADQRAVPVHRVSQGSGISRLTAGELRAMATIGATHSIEVYLFMGVRGENGLGYQARSPGGGSTRKRLQGSRQFAAALREVDRALAAGIRGFLVSDEGLLVSLAALRKDGSIPAEVALKTSVSMGYGNAAAVRWLEAAGADSFNLPVDLDLQTLSDIRHAVTIPLDQYVEAPALLGGGQRFDEVGEIVEACAPVNLKFGLSTEELTDPVGLHSRDLAIAQVRERVRLAALGFELLTEQGMGDAVAATDRRRPGVPVAP